jgi:hypothetical protein
MSGMQILIGLFQCHSDGWGSLSWTLDHVAPTIQINHDTWPLPGDDDRFAGQPAALGIVTLTHDGERNPYKPWRAECGHPGNGEVINTGDMEIREKALEALKKAVAAR